MSDFRLDHEATTPTTLDFQKKTEIETVTASQLHQLQAKKSKDVRFSA